MRIIFLDPVAQRIASISSTAVALHPCLPVTVQVTGV